MDRWQTYAQAEHIGVWHKEGTMKQIEPPGDHLVVKPKPREEKTKGGIFLPDTPSKERPM
jgi:hypothetical protein